MRRKAQSHDAWGKYLQTGCSTGSALSWLSHRDAKGSGCHAALGSPPRHFPVGFLYLTQTALPSKSRPSALKILMQNSSCHGPGQVWVTASLGSGIWLRYEMLLNLW